MEVRGLLPVELAAHRAAVLGGAEPLEAVVDQLRVLLVEVLVSHDVGGAGVHLAAAHLHSAEGRAQRCRRPAAQTTVSLLVRKAFSVKAHFAKRKKKKKAMFGGGLRRDGS